MRSLSSEWHVQAPGGGLTLKALQRAVLQGWAQPLPLDRRKALKQELAAVVRPPALCLAALVNRARKASFHKTSLCSADCFIVQVARSSKFRLEGHLVCLG